MNAETLIKKHEGYRDRVYLCSEGYPTLGYGHALHVGSRVPERVSELFFEMDMVQVYADYRSLGFSLDPVRKAVAVNMLFNLGLAGLRKFKNTIKAIKNGDYVLASAEMLNSKWATQVGMRAHELAEMMRTGEWPREV